MLLSKTTCSNSHIHSYIDAAGCHARCRPAHQEQLWGSVSCPRTLRHADQGNGTSDLLITRRWLYPHDFSLPRSPFRFFLCLAGGSGNGH